jgi:hypothetical protein
MVGRTPSSAAGPLAGLTGWRLPNRDREGADPENVNMAHSFSRPVPICDYDIRSLEFSF